MTNELNETNELLRLVLCRGSNGNSVTVQLDSFLRFNAAMDHSLESLVGRWADYITPCSLRESENRSRF